MKRYIIAYLPERFVDHEIPYHLINEWIGYLYECGASDVKILNYYDNIKGWKVEYEIRANPIYWRPVKLNSTRSPIGMAVFMNKKKYKKLKAKRGFGYVELHKRKNG